jgi:hypothetical protein
LRHPSAANDSAPSHRNTGVFISPPMPKIFKTSPKNDHPRIAQNVFSGFSTIFYILPKGIQNHSIMIANI